MGEQREVLGLHHKLCVCVCYWISSLDTASNLAKFTRKKDADFALTLIYF